MQLEDLEQCQIEVQNTFYNSRDYFAVMAFVWLRVPALWTEVGEETCSNLLISVQLKMHTEETSPYSPNVTAGNFRILANLWISYNPFEELRKSHNRT